jgi:hypothetical protein
LIAPQNTSRKHHPRSHERPTYIPYTTNSPGRFMNRRSSLIFMSGGKEMKGNDHKNMTKN